MTDDGLAVTEAILTEALDSVPESLREPCRRIVAAEHQRLRAGLVLAVAGRAWPGTSRRTARAAAAVELLHLGTAVHDDARLLQGVPSIDAKEGAAVALLAGNVLTGLAFRLAAAAGAGDLLGEAVVGLNAGRALAADHQLPSADLALGIAELRTGTLFGAAARLGAIVTGTPEDGLAECGLAFGTAVQLLDDVLDLPDDFAAGRATLPVVHTLAARPDLRRLQDPELDPLCAGVPATLRTVGELVDRAAAARPELGDLIRQYRDAQLALIASRYRAVLSS
ncbi:polyprenyl synthetase family protein [Actinoplanes sp. NPDC049599]|uniref:polyprenyl synthetase family protein n=1 Tax=Actinoplanes sp. NPDC049599 TaxID=3363903 RepID=UPI0037986CA6